MMLCEGCKNFISDKCRDCNMPDWKNFEPKPPVHFTTTTDWPTAPTKIEGEMNHWPTFRVNDKGERI